MSTQPQPFPADESPFMSANMCSHSFPSSNTSLTRSGQSQQPQSGFSQNRGAAQGGRPSTQEKGGPTATAPFLQDFSLVAEAAKRAQMAVLMRDLEGVSL
ncbi:uncharacterized protein CIMG_10466 [Coccidioides immitis RS]|uniref:Thiol methyltransferase n=3 Tax=Coccidioides immitis TaxID=5501 RepID=A0A0D8JTD0_COCIM|nr:uncharacterized protein CIMG_10466 [Coccidioides immitis RS]KJF60379.1 hypothetical protein CIMG_10466 [Coccidioides immitis RS]KMO99911.1 hypothetical protein CIRG_00054 [Coccidioides immitis RMSCC 2394]KMU75866.1 hypothetical protein CISG_05263 [Coccidioides immitis RMSCC 3703]